MIIDIDIILAALFTVSFTSISAWELVSYIVVARRCYPAPVCRGFACNQPASHVRCGRIETFLCDKCVRRIYPEQKPDDLLGS
jgi:hypothetical protein